MLVSISCLSFNALQVKKLQEQLNLLSNQLDQQRQAAAAASKAAASAQAAAAAAQAESSSHAARVGEVEGEMAQLLAVVEAQKAASAAKMRQLACLLQDL
jgi:leucine-rich repeat/coiled-coil domain-containing protein 1